MQQEGPSAEKLRRERTLRLDIGRLSVTWREQLQLNEVRSQMTRCGVSRGEEAEARSVQELGLEWGH